MRFGIDRQALVIQHPQLLLIPTDPGISGTPEQTPRLQRVVYTRAHRNSEALITTRCSAMPGTSDARSAPEVDNGEAMTGADDLNHPLGQVP